MINQIKKFTLQVIAGANVAAILLMLLVGFSGHLDPAAHPMLATVGLTFPGLLLLNFLFLLFWLIVKTRYALLPFAGFVVGFVPVRTYFPINGPQSQPDHAIKVLSYNVENFGRKELADSTVEANPIITYLRDSKADIICLQEAWDHEQAGDSVLKAIYPYTSFETGQKKGDLLAVYSRYPIHRIEQIPYTSDINISFAYNIMVDGHEVLLVNNHLESNGLEPTEKNRFTSMVKGQLDGDSARIESDYLIDKLAAAARRRAPQVDAVVRYIASRRGGRPIICCGDFNENPISYSHIRFSDILNDCYVASGNGPGFSYNRNLINVRIDNIFCSDHFTPHGAKVDRSINLSDHYPIFCWLNWR
jgi:endonuclease/exonuclease/phosphatase family metal-dependent hydrolase